MPLTVVTDEEGNTMPLFEFQGKFYPNFPFVQADEVLSNLPNLAGREDDVVIVTYPKSGTNWIWEIINMLFAAKGGMGNTNRKPVEGMLEFHPSESLSNMLSVRLLVTHLPTDFYPTDLIKKKSKIVYVMRNPKDALVSYFLFARKMKIYGYEGTWNGFFSLFMDGKSPYGNWFDHTKAWYNFFKEHADVPFLILYYENMKKDLHGGIQKLAEFLDIHCEDDLVTDVAERCTFDNMKKNHAQLQGVLENAAIGESNPLYRKGIIGDWKNYFTVAQNEKFDRVYAKEMAGWTFDFDQYIK